MFFRLAAFNLRLRRSLGFSKCWCRRRSDRIPAFSHFFLKRRRALSKDSPSFTLIPGKYLPPLCPVEELEFDEKPITRRAARPNGVITPKPVYGTSHQASTPVRILTRN